MTLEATTSKDPVGKDEDKDQTGSDPMAEEVRELEAIINDLGGKIRVAKAEQKDRIEWGPLLQEMLEAL